VGLGYRNPSFGRIQQYSIDWNHRRGRAPSRHSATRLVTRSVPGAGQRLFISGRRKVNARTRRGGERAVGAVIEIQSRAAGGWTGTGRPSAAGRARIGGNRSAHRTIAWSMPLVSDIDQPRDERWPVSGPPAVTPSHRRLSAQHELSLWLPVRELPHGKRQRRRRRRRYCSAVMFLVSGYFLLNTVVSPRRLHFPECYFSAYLYWHTFLSC